jgi:hypothetical protein
LTLHRAFSSSRDTWITSAILAVPVALVLLPLAFGYTLLPSDLYDSLTLPFSRRFSPQSASNHFVSDAILQFYPYKMYLRDAWLHGRFAFWNPYILCGYPQYAETMATNFDVLNSLLVVLPMPFGFFVYAMAPLFIAGMGMWWLARGYGVRIWIARLAAIAFMLNGLFFTHLYPHFIPGSFCWIPFLVLFLKRRIDGGGLRMIGLASVACALAWLGGNIQTAAFVVVVAALFVFCYPSATRLWSRLISLGSVLLLAFLLSLVMWAPTLELFYHVTREGVVASTSLVRPYSLLQRVLTLPLLLTFLVPTVGTVANGFSLYNLIGAYTIDFNASIGFFAILFGVWGGIRYRSDASFRPFLIIAMCALLLPIATPLYHYLYHRFFIALVFGLVMLMALTLERSFGADQDRIALARFGKRAATIAGSVSVLLFIVACALTFAHEWIEPAAESWVRSHMAGSAFADGNTQWMSDRLTHTLDAFSLGSWTLWMTLLGLGIAAAGARRLPGDERRSLILLVLGTAIQLLTFAFAWMPIPNAAQYPIFPKTAVTDSLSGSTSRVFVDRHLYTGHQYLFLNNSNIQYGIAEVSGFESLLPRSFYVAFSARADTIPPLPLLSALGVGRIVTGDWVSLHDSSLSQQSIDGLNIYTIHRDHERVWLAPSAIISDDSSTLRTLFSAAYDRKIVMINDPVQLSPLPTSDLIGSVAITTDDPEHLSIRASASRECYMVLSDTWYPGWTARVDGVDRPITRANFAMRAIRIPAGSHTIEMTFEPLSWKIGWIGSLAALAIAIVLIATGPQKHRESGFQN